MRGFLSYMFLIFLGYLGAHRFYLGRYLSGFVYACTGGICGLGIIYDFFIGLPIMLASPRGPAVDDFPIGQKTTHTRYCQCCGAQLSGCNCKG